ncbi:hypothetical protein BLNAU_19247 [Blattamonas nauphoetae]|uniref:Uncharacterized protein n=1 Tax=Blattamonas nauphoetae TaxID=2049346 RepID=A0ABQ9X4G2_9EUKA|nr:hypothetical protein BLNAU_19247 [Blattamonas nauphoetae]
MYRLKHSSLLHRLNVVKWDPDDMGDSEDMYMNGMQSSVLTVQTQMPSLVFTDPFNFRVEDNRISSVYQAIEEEDYDQSLKLTSSSFLLSEPFTEGIVVISFTVLVKNNSSVASFCGLIDGTAPIPEEGLIRQLHRLELSFHLFDTCAVIHSVSTVFGENMDSTPRTVQFFVNGKTGKSYVSGIPESVRLGFSADVMGTSLQIASIVHSTRPTPLTDTMTEIKWTDNEKSLKKRKEKHYEPIRREPEGSMPALLLRNPDHFKIEGNVITRTAVGSTALTSPFSSVMIDEEFMYKGSSVTITILALPQTKNSRGVLMFGSLDEKLHIPKSPKGLGLQKELAAVAMQLTSNSDCVQLPLSQPVANSVDLGSFSFLSTQEQVNTILSIAYHHILRPIPGSDVFSFMWHHQQLNLSGRRFFTMMAPPRPMSAKSAHTVERDISAHTDSVTHSPTIVTAAETVALSSLSVRIRAVEVDSARSASTYRRMLITRQSTRSRPLTGHYSRLVDGGKASLAKSVGDGEELHGIVEMPSQISLTDRDAQRA